jgi:DNA topoisomerase I
MAAVEVWRLQDLNVKMKEYMDGLSVKVFRTFNASVTLDRLLWEPTSSAEVVAKKADYDRANKEVRRPGLP